MSSHSSNTLSELTFHNEDTIKCLPLEMGPPEAVGERLQIKNKLRAIVKEFF